MCADSDSLPRVADAGALVERDGVKLQVMHNGLLIEEGGYFGRWMTEIIRSARGVHEPQEEVVFDRVIRELVKTGGTPTMIEFGSNWTYYGMWFAKSLPEGRVVAMEPDPDSFELGRRNARINHLEDRIHFVRGAVGADVGAALTLNADVDGREYEVPQYDLASLMAESGLDRVDLILVDIQGAETVLLQRALADFAAGRVRFAIISTHHHSISGDPLTHQNALALLRDAGAHVIAEHTVSESYSGDGLIAVSFDQRDGDVTVPVSFARAKESLFGEVEFDLARAITEARVTESELTRLRNTKLFRLSAPARSFYGRIRRRPRS
jgi:FkbM family methyltransferase